MDENYFTVQFGVLLTGSKVITSVKHGMHKEAVIFLCYF